MMSRVMSAPGGHSGSIEVPGMKHVAVPIALACFLMSPPAAPEEAQSFSKDQIAAGAELYAVNCSPCHGARMQDPSGAFNLRKISGRPARTLRQFGDARQEPDAAMGRLLQARPA